MAPTHKKERTYGAAHFSFELGQDKHVGFFHSLDGGGIKAELINHPVSHRGPGSPHRDWSQIGFPKYEDIKIQVGMSMGSVFYEWIESFFRGDVVRYGGAIVAGDFHYKERARREMSQMLISEVSLPALDASNKNPCHMSVTIVPERVDFKPGSNADLPRNNAKTNQKPWTSSNFAVRIDGFETECKRVLKVDSFAVKTQVQEHRVGNRRDAIRVPGRLEMPTLSIHIPEADSEGFVKHYTRYTQNGAKQPSPRLTGEVEFRDHEGKNLCSVEMFGLDILGVTPSKSEAKSTDVKTMKVDFSLEQVKFKWVR